MLKDKKDLKRYQDKMMEAAKGTIGLGIMTGMGTYAFGRIGANNPVTQPTTSAVTTGLNLTNVGNVAGIGMSIASEFSGKEKKQDKKEKNKKKINDPLKFI